MNTPKDFQVIQAVLQGDQEAFAGLVRAHHVPVLNQCRSMLLDLAEAEDAAQDVFLKAFRSLHTYKRDQSFSAWLYRIASNQCLDVLRRRKRQRTDSLDGLIEQRGETADSHPWEASPSEEALSDRRDHTAFARQALARLSVEERQILILRELDELPYDQIGVILGCTLDAVKARLRRARIRLREEARHFLGEKTFIQ